MDAIVQKAVSNRNTFLEENSMLKDISPRTIVRGQPKVDFNECKLELGQYCEVYTHPDPTNKQHTRLVGAIAILTSNNNCGYPFISIMTAKKIHSYIWHKLPMKKPFIHMVNQLGKKENQPLMNKDCLMFEWAPGDPFFDDKDEIDAFDANYKSKPDDSNDDHNLDDGDYDMSENDPGAILAEDQKSKDHDNNNDYKNDNNHDDDNTHADGHEGPDEVEAAVVEANEVAAAEEASKVELQNHVTDNKEEDNDEEVEDQEDNKDEETEEATATTNAAQRNNNNDTEDETQRSKEIHEAQSSANNNDEEKHEAQRSGTTDEEEHEAQKE